MPHVDSSHPLLKNQGTTGYNGRSRINLWSWLIALSILFLLIIQVPREALYLACKEGPWLLLGGYTILQALLILLLDAYAIQVSLLVLEVKQSLKVLFFVRGASYIFGILNYALGQGVMGLYLQRLGLPASRCAGIILFLLVVNFGVVLLLGGGGLAVSGGRCCELIDSPFLASGLIAGVLAYLAIIIFRPQFLEKYRIIRPLLEAGLWGHLKAALGRMPHILLLVITFWGAIRLWGIPVPIVPGVTIVALVLLVSSLPLTPFGLGTSQTVLMVMCSPYVPSPDSEIKTATAMAFSLIYYSFGIIIQAFLSILCWQRIKSIEIPPKK